MTTSFSIDEVRKIARLSSLELTDNEAEVFAEQFSTILDYFELLKTVDIPETVTDVDESDLTGIRHDKMEESPVSPEKLEIPPSYHDEFQLNHFHQRLLLFLEYQLFSIIQNNPEWSKTVPQKLLLHCQSIPMMKVSLSCELHLC